MHRDPSGYWKMIGIKGDLPGHPFRGNQYTDRDAASEGEQQVLRDESGSPFIGDVKLGDASVAGLVYDDHDTIATLPPEQRVPYEKARNSVYAFAKTQGDTGQYEKGKVLVGTKLYDAETMEGGVRVPASVRDEMEHLIHNHPSGASFSGSDIANLWGRPSQRSVEAITKDGTVYRLERTSNIGRSRPDIAEALRNYWHEMYYGLQQKYKEHELYETHYINNHEVSRGTPLFIKECDRIVREIVNRFPEHMRYTVTKVAGTGKKKALTDVVEVQGESLDEFAARVGPFEEGDYSWEDDRIFNIKREPEK